VKLYIYLVLSPRGCRPLPPGTKYELKKIEPKIYAEENLVKLYIYSVSVEFPHPQIQNIHLKISNLWCPVKVLTENPNPLRY